MEGENANLVIPLNRDFISIDGENFSLLNLIPNEHRLGIDDCGRSSRPIVNSLQAKLRKGVRSRS